MLKPITGKNQVISTDAIVVAKTHTDSKRTGADGECVSLTVLDHWSGFNYGFPTGTSSTDKYWYCLKFWVGPGWTKKPEIIVKSDSDPAILAAVVQLGWHSEPSLPNTKTHGARHERHHAVLKSVTRTSVAVRPEQ